MLKAEGINLELSNHTVLSDVSLSIEPGTVSVIMGPNGAGKTCLLRVLAGDINPNSGTVLLNGKNMQQWRSDQRARMLSVLPQSSNLNFPFNVGEVVSLGRIPHSTGYKRDREIVQSALRRVGALHLEQRLYPELSGGEKQRVQLARVLCQIWEPCEHGDRVLFLDEPSSSLDLAHQQLLLETVNYFAGEGLAVGMVMHDFALTASCASQLVFLKDGVVRACGPLREVMTEQCVEDVFGVKVELVIDVKTNLPINVRCV